MFRKILVAMDESEPSRKAAMKAVELAKKDMASLIGVHVLDVDELNIMDIGSERLAQLEKKQKEKGESALRYLEDLAGKEGLRYEGILTKGHPDKTILEMARTHGVDLIVVGTHGRRGIARIMDPETPDEIRKECPDCPLLIVP